MLVLRRFLLNRPALSALIVACALMLKILVPSGFMLGTEGGMITIEICSGTGPMKLSMAMPGTDHKQDHQGKEMPCAFSALSAASMAATDAILLAVAIIFILATVLRGSIEAPARVPAYLRPHLRGPPVPA